MDEDKEIKLLNKKIDMLLKNEGEIINKLNSIDKKEGAIQAGERTEAEESHKIEAMEENERDELKKLEALEEEVKESVIPSPLSKVTYRDVVKGTIGAFVGIVSHFSFFEGVHHAENMTMFRATILLITSFLIGGLFIYFSGFRKVKTVRVLQFIPLRITTIFFTAIAVIVIVFWLFGVIDSHTTFSEIYKMVATTSILAMLGAGTADLIGEH